VKSGGGKLAPLIRLTSVKTIIGAVLPMGWSVG